MTISEKAPAAEAIPMFPVGTDVEKSRQLRLLPCDVTGPFGSWRKWYVDAHPACQTRHPRCNRTTCHAGPHRVYDTKAHVRAEWR